MSTETPRGGGTRPPLREAVCFRNCRSDSYHEIAEDGEGPACPAAAQSRDAEWRVAEHQGQLPIGVEPCRFCFGDVPPPDSPGPTCPLCKEPVASVGLDGHLPDCPARE